MYLRGDRTVRRQRQHFDPSRGGTLSPEPARIAALVALVMLLWQGLVRAQAPAGDADTGELAVHLELVAPASCADESDLVRRISRRSHRIKFVPARSGVPTVRAELRVSDRSVTTTLTLRSAEGAGSSSRTVQAQNCDDAVEATALLAAVMLDPTALTGPSDEIPESEPGVTPSASARPAPPPPLPPRKPPPPPAPPPRKAGFEGFAGADIEAIFAGPAPRVVRGLGASFMARWPRDSLWSVSGRISILSVGTGRFEVTPTGAAALTLAAGRIELCPVRFGDNAASVYGCGMYLIGSLSSDGTVGNVHVEGESRLFSTFGISAIGSLKLWGPLEIVGGPSVSYIPVRDAYALEDPSTHAVTLFHRVPQLMASGVIALGARFP